MSSDNEKTEEDEKTYWRRKDIEELDEKKIDTLLLLGCNTGLDNPQDFPMKVSSEESVAYDYTMAEAFYKDKNADSIGRIIASDGSIWHGYRDGHHTMQSKGNALYHGTKRDQLMEKIFVNIFKTHWAVKNNTGIKVYTNEDGIINYNVIGTSKYRGLQKLLNACGIYKNSLFEKE